MTGLDMTDERAQRAVKTFRKMQTQLTAYARAITKNPGVRVVMSSESAHTDGKFIYYRPPIALGDNLSHDRALCDKRDPDTRLQMCPACAIGERVRCSIYHEIGHLVGGSFAEVTEEQKREALMVALRELGHAPAYIRSESFVSLANSINPYLALLFNAVEDARVDLNMVTLRRGLKVMMEASSNQIFRDGVERGGGQDNLPWAEQPLNAQAAVACMLRIIGYTGWESRLNPAVVDHTSAPAIEAVLDQLRKSRSAADTFRLTYPLMEELRKFGYFKKPDEIPPPPAPPETGDEEPQDGDDDSGDDAGDDQSTDDAQEDSSDDDRQDSSEVPPEDADSTGDSVADGDSSEDEDDQSSSGDDASEGETSPSADKEGSEHSEDSGTGEADDTSNDEAGDPQEGDEVDDQDADGSGGDLQEDQQEESDSDGGSSGAPDSDPSADGTDAADGQDPGADPGDADGDSEAAGGDQPGGSADPDAGGDQDSADDDGDSTGAGGHHPEGEPSDAGSDGDGEPREEVGDSPGGTGGSTGSGEDADQGDSDAGQGDDDSDRTEEDRDGDGSDGTSEQEGVGDADSEERDVEGDDGSGDPTDLRDSTEPDGDGAGGDEPDQDEPVAGAEPDDSDTPWDADHEHGRDGQPCDCHSCVEYGTPQEVGEAVEQSHAQIGHLDGEDKGDEDLSLTILIAQGAHFDTSSVNIMGVEEHKDGDRFFEEDPNQDVIPEEFIAPALLHTRRAFSDNKKAAVERNLKTGRVNVTALGRRAWNNDPRLFDKRKVPGKKDYSVLIGIDLSSSTIGHRATRIRKAALAQAELCHRAGIRFAVYGHSGGAVSLGDEDSWAMMMDIVIVKEFDQPWDEAARNRMKCVRPSGGNVDGHTFEYYRKRLDEEMTTDRILMYYTDGAMPAANKEEETEILLRELKIFKQRGYVAMGVGIGTDSPTQYGLETFHLDSYEDIKGVVMFLKKMIGQHA